MQLINDTDVRDKIVACLLYTSNLMPELKESKLDIDNIDALCKVFISENQGTIIERIKKELDSELSIGYFGALTVGLMSFSMQFENLRLIDPNILGINNLADPNRILSALLSNITNYVLGILKLVESGLESPARTCLRSMLELSWLTLVIVGDREKMLTYLENSDNNEKDVYFKHFSSKKLWSAISKIENELGFTDEVSNMLNNIRRELYSMYSKNVHHSYGDLITGSLSYSFEKDDYWSPNLFGKADKASYPTLRHMNDAIFTFLGVLVQSLTLHHKLSPPYPDSLQRVMALKECFAFLVVHREEKIADSN